MNRRGPWTHRSTLGRRTFLGSGAALIGLPFLESLVPRAARAQTAQARRLIYYFVPNGIDMATFRPTSAGANYTVPPMLVPLASLKADFSVVTGLENVPAKPEVAGDHPTGTAGLITCAHAKKSSTEIVLGVSADQVAAKAIGSATRLPSLQLGIDAGKSSGSCDAGYSCVYNGNISWADANTPLPKLVDPTAVFDRIFAGTNATDSAAAAAKRRAYDQSVLDLAIGDATTLKGKLGRTDAVKLEQYLTGVRELEKRINTTVTGPSCTPGAKPADTTDFAAKVGLMHDLMVLVLRCDATRIITFMLGNGVSVRTYPNLGITGGHHTISHHGNDPAKLAQLAAIGKYEVEQFASLLTKMKAVKDGSDGSTLLDNTAVFFSSDVSDGNRHNHDDMPILLAGRGGGTLRPGRHIQYALDMHQKVSNLLVAMLGTIGLTNAKLGDSTAPLTDL